MAKIYGLQGAMTGQLGNSVMAVRNGEQIARQYQPIVSNPNTANQVAVRAKLKLMSQLSAVVGRYIAIPRQGAVSPRNMFVKQNYFLVTYSSDEANIDLNSVQLTKSAVGLPAISATRGEEYFNLQLSAPAPDLNRVVYVVFSKDTDGKLRFLSSVVSSTPETQGQGWFIAQTPITPSEVVIYAYGVRDNTEAARAIFGNLTALTAETMAKLIVTRKLLETDVTLTETRAITLVAAE